jgi:signal transduction histidine kinase/CheY-like chemotaxis protein
METSMHEGICGGALRGLRGDFPKQGRGAIQWRAASCMMGFWRHKKRKTTSQRSLSRAAREGASREELTAIAGERLRVLTGADRIGVWILENPGREEFRGWVWDSAQEPFPPGWKRFSPGTTLLARMNADGKSLEQVLDGSAGNPIVGPLVGMQRAIWAPVEGEGEWEGLLMAACRHRRPSLPRFEIESVSADLALALGYQGLESAVRRQAADLAFTRTIVSGAGNGANLEKRLGEILRMGAAEAGAGFLAVGRLKSEGPGVSEVAWCNVDHEWLAHLESEPLRQLWRQALGTGFAAGTEHSGALPEPGFSRWAAVPIRIGGRPLGVLIAGLLPQGCSFATLEWLELRAVLAGNVLAEWELREEKTSREQRERGRIAAAPEALLLLDDAGVIRAASAGAKRLLDGLPAEPGTEFASLLRNSEAAASWLRSFHQDGKSQQGHLEAELPDGRRIRARALLTAGEGLAGLLMEIADASQFSPSALPADCELRTLLDWIEQGVLIFDAEQRIVAMNRRFPEIAWLDPAEAREIRTLEGMIERFSGLAEEPGELAGQWRELARLEEGGIREELRLSQPVPRVLERAARPILDDTGRKVGWLEVYRDVTAGKVFQARLQRAEKLAAIGQMVSGIAHELSNPLTSILGYAQRLLLRPKFGESEEVQKIHLEAGRASRMLRQLLESSRETRPQRKTVSLNQLVERAMELRAIGHASKHIRLETVLDPSAPLLFGDEDHLQQVVTNLVANAEQAIGPGSGKIRVSTQRSGEGTVRLEVSDSGPGIPPALLYRIFEPFFTTKPVGAGTGLGLAIVFNIVREHGGRVHAANRPGGGAVFTVELPTWVPEAAVHAWPRNARAAPPALEVVRSGETPSQPSPSALRALVVEDEPTVARLIADVLRDEGVEAEVLLDGHEALNRAAQQSYDLVVCDLKMPGLDGRQFYEGLLRQGSPLCGRFLFVTGDALAAPALEFLERNRVPYVHKPFRVEELTQAVRILLRTASAPPLKRAAARNES